MRKKSSKHSDEKSKKKNGKCDACMASWTWTNMTVTNHKICLSEFEMHARFNAITTYVWMTVQSIGTA